MHSAFAYFVYMGVFAGGGANPSTKHWKLLAQFKVHVYLLSFAVIWLICWVHVGNSKPKDTDIWAMQCFLKFSSVRKEGGLTQL